jgi:hypothetical protein
VFTLQPGGSTGGVAFAAQPQVAVQDLYGNTVTGDTSSVTLAITTNPGGGTLTCAANPLAATAGVATFTGCAIDRPGTGYRLTATDGSLTVATSTTFNITLGPPAKLAFTTQPLGAHGGSPFATQPVVAIQDAGGNTVTAATSAVTLTIGTNPGAGTLACATNPLNATAGVATFVGCTINNMGNGYTLVATAPSLAPATSNPFDVSVASQTRTASGDLTPALPGNVQVNDLMLLIVSNTKVSDVRSVSAGWQSVAVASNSAGQGIHLSVYYRFFQAGDTAPTVNVDTDSGGASARVIAYSNVNTGNPFDGAAVTTTSPNTSSFTPTGLSTTFANSRAVSIVAENNNTSTVPALSLGAAQGFGMEPGFPDAWPNGNNSNHHSVAVAGKIVPTAGAVTFPTFSTDTAGVWAGVSIALRP